MAEWWLLDKSTQDGIAAHLDGAAKRVLNHYDAHGEGGLPQMRAEGCR